jgi:hypothetical protein
MCASNCRVWEYKHRNDIAKTFAKVFGDNDAILGGDLSGTVAQIAADAVEIGRLVNEPSVQCDDGSLVINAEAVKALRERIRDNAKELQRRACPHCGGAGLSETELHEGLSNCPDCSAS